MEDLTWYEKLQLKTCLNLYSVETLLTRMNHYASELYYTCLSILLATFNYRVRGTCVPTRPFHARLAH